MTTEEMVCPLCGQVDVLAESENVLLIKSPWFDNSFVVTLKDHKDVPTADEYREALTLVSTQYPQAMLGECSDAIGHWAATVIKIDRAGVSKMYEEKP